MVVGDDRRHISLAAIANWRPCRDIWSAYASAVRAFMTHTSVIRHGSMYCSLPSGQVTCSWHFCFCRGCCAVSRKRFAVRRCAFPYGNPPFLSELDEKAVSFWPRRLYMSKLQKTTTLKTIFAENTTLHFLAENTTSCVTVLQKPLIGGLELFEHVYDRWVSFIRS
jgi:hypothetical protein